MTISPVGNRKVAEILNVPAIFGELDDRSPLLNTLQTHRIDTVMHFAAYAYVGESVDKPLFYYDNNVATTVHVLQCMQEAGVKRFVFSSTLRHLWRPRSRPDCRNRQTGAGVALWTQQVDGGAGSQRLRRVR